MKTSACIQRHRCRSPGTSSATLCQVEQRSRSTPAANTRLGLEHRPLPTLGWVFRGFDQTWSRESVGYRQGEFGEGEALASIVVVVIGGPALLVGANLVAAGNLSVGQALLIAPLAALLGAGIVGTNGTIAAQTGTAGTALMRPSFGRIGAVVVSVVRLIMVALWAVIGLEMAGTWATDATADLAIGLPTSAWIGIVALLGLGLVALGVVPTVRSVIKRPLFVASVLLVAVLGWRLVSNGFEVTADGSGSFWEGLQRAVEASVIFLPFVESVGRRLNNEDDAFSSFSVGYAVTATLMIAAGAIVALRFGNIDDLISIEPGTAGAALLIAWVVVAEIDQAFAAFVAAGSETIGILRLGPAWLVGLVIAVLIGVAAVFVTIPVEVASMATSLVFPAALIVLFDFHLVRDRYYTEADIGAGASTLNSAGVGCWLVAVILGQLLDPIGPAVWVDAVPSPGIEVDLPWRLVISLVMATTYMLITRWGGHRTASIYEIRGVSTYGRGD